MMVLRAVVEDYIRSQEPVGSAALAKHHQLGVSSATIRNDMSALEEEGYLIQPHTSAGRIPTEKGYRYFVDGLAAVIPLSEPQRRAIRNFLSGSVSLQDTLQRSARLLASITGQVALVAAPALSRASVRRIELVQVSMSMLLAVVITDTGSVAQHMLQISDVNAEELSQSIATINKLCVGLSLREAARTLQTISTTIASAHIRNLLRSLVDALEDMHIGEHTHDLYMAGASQLAHRQTMSDFASLFDALEEQAVIMRLMTAMSEEASDCASGVSVAIGSETHNPGLLHASVVTSGYGYDPDASTDSADFTSSNVDSGNAGSGNADAVYVDSVKAAFINNIDNQPMNESSSQADVSTQESNIDRTHRQNMPVAFIGSIGPQHMDYVATMAAVKAVARYLNAFIAQNR
ncbi:transcription repressor HrcA [Gardnerella vaginalis]|uniref:Heat-inducible transcription repressor HrcA n=2 Tax=Gardnerella vaginalis TaxID=2702 RepID=A0A133NX90_GARVA|nr:transcription repressor HrcA [Gardnerella vaginalis]